MLIARAPVRISFGEGGTDLEAYYLRLGSVVVSATILSMSGHSHVML
jgi:D-glycero-alpha-D-manno-heptose-7-phosphate kinase